MSGVGVIRNFLLRLNEWKALVVACSDRIINVENGCWAKSDRRPWRIEPDATGHVYRVNKHVNNVAGNVNSDGFACN